MWDSVMFLSVIRNIIFLFAVHTVKTRMHTSWSNIFCLRPGFILFLPVPYFCLMSSHLLSFFFSTSFTFLSLRRTREQVFWTFIWRMRVLLVKYGWNTLCNILSTFQHFYSVKNDLLLGPSQQYIWCNLTACFPVCVYHERMMTLFIYYMNHINQHFVVI